MKNLLIFLLALSLPLSISAQVKKGKDGKDVVVDSSPKMQQAMLKSIETIDLFLDSLEKKNPNHTRHGLKIRYQEDDITEYLWVYQIEVNQGGIFGHLGNNPFNAKEIKFGDKLRVLPKDVVDWSYIDNGVLVGGYTLRVMFEQYDEAQKKEIQKKLGYKILESKK